MKRLQIKMIGEEFSLEEEDKSKSAPKVKDAEKLTVEEECAPSLDMAQDNVSIPKDVLAALVKAAGKGGTSNVDKELADAIKQLAEAANNTSDASSGRRFLGGRPIDAIQIDKEDLLQVPAIFFAHSVSYSVYDDKRDGHTVRSPYNRAFKFKPIQRVVQNSSTRNPTYLSLSAVIIRSKKEAEWLREHTLNGIKFFEKRDEGRDVTLEQLDKITRAWGIVQSMDDLTVAQRAASEGLSINTADISKLRKKLALALAKSMGKEDDKLRKNHVKDLEDFLSNNLKSPEEQFQGAHPNSY